MHEVQSTREYTKTQSPVTLPIEKVFVRCIVLCTVIRDGTLNKTQRTAFHFTVIIYLVIRAAGVSEIAVGGKI